MPARTLLTLLLTLLAACNSPPLYESKAREFLLAQGITEQVIGKLDDRASLDNNEVAQLARFEYPVSLPWLASWSQRFSSAGRIATLHLLASNPSAPPELLTRLIQHPIEDVRWGAATNPLTPLTLLYAQRSMGKYSTMNAYLAHNPALPSTVLWKMYRVHEAAGYDFAMNPSCPLDLMQEIFTHGNEQDRTWLAWNKNLPEEIMQQLAQDPSPSVQRMLQANPVYQH